MVDHKDKTKGPVERVELIVGEARRRVWTDEQKGRIVAESLAPGVVCQLASNFGSDSHLMVIRPQTRGGS